MLKQKYWSDDATTRVHLFAYFFFFIVERKMSVGGEDELLLTKSAYIVFAV